MASDNASVVTSSTLAHDAPAALDDLARTKSLKRAREITPTSPPPVAHVSDLSPAKIARLVGYTTQAQSQSSSAAAHEEKRQQRTEEQVSENSFNIALQTLEEAMSGAVAAMSRPQDSQPPIQEPVDAAAAATARALASVQIPTDSNVGDPQEISPSSAVTGGSLEDGENQVVHSPAVMDVDPPGHQRMYTAQPEAQMEDKAASSLSYPGLPVTSMPAPAPPQRGMSMPMANTQTPDLTPRSPSSKKHRCPYCETEFTRHHNLKSHLLTHSQEKPYLCQQCQMRFRRLHDLKRHSKLHTGEKPHICPKCDRKFARGDALARHSKGAGGCAGRRSSMGFGGEEDFEGASMVEGDDSAMAGVLYDNSVDASLTEEDRRRLSMPSIKTQHVAGQAGQEGVAHSNTYPPPGPRPAGGLYPPNMDRGSTSSTTSPSLQNSHTPHTSISSMPLSAGSTSVFSQSGMTESPKPLSPGGAQTNQTGQKRVASQQSGSGLSMPSHVNAAAAAAGRGRGRGVTVAAQRQVSDGTGAEGTGASGPDPTILAYFRHLDDKITKLTADLEARNQQEAQLLERLEGQDQHIALLTGQVAELRAALQPQAAAVPQEQAAASQE